MGLVGKGKIKDKLDELLGDRLTEAEKQKIAKFTSDQVKLTDILPLIKGDEAKLKEIEQRVRDALKNADKDTQDLFEKLEELKEEILKEQKEKEEREKEKCK